MINLFIIHSYNADTKRSFGPYLADCGKKLGLNVIFPDFPVKENAKYQKWAEIMDQYFLSGQLNEDAIVVAHSLGTHFIPKYLAERNIAIKLYISCAGFLNNFSGREDLQNIIDDFKPTYQQIARSRDLMKNRYSIYSNNDHLSPEKELENYAESFNSEKVFIPNIGHLGESSGITELPVVLEIIKKHLENYKKL